MSQTAEEYYEDLESHGNYQYVSLKEIIDELLVETTDDDSYLKNTSRTKIIMHVKNGLGELNREVKKNVLAIEMTVNSGLYIPLPQDYIDWIRISVLGPDFKLYPLDINTSINTATGYLQDNNAEILFDNDGWILTSDSTNAFSSPHKSYTINSTANGNIALDTTKLSIHGECKVDQRRGQIIFSEHLEDKEVVLEYYSDGMQMEDIYSEEVTIHKSLKDALISYAYSNSISKKRNVPWNEKKRAKDEYKSLKHKAKLDCADFEYNKINKLMGSKQI